jgi:protein arginine kinase
MDCLAIVGRRKTQMEFNDLTNSNGEWLRGAGPESDIVISSRIRLARNLADFPFLSRATESDRISIETSLRGAVASLKTSQRLSEGTLYIDVSNLEHVDRQFLVERQLISRELADSNGARAVVIDPAEKFSLMINEEDHLRLQVMQSGLNLQSAWEQMTQLDDLIEEQVTYAFSERLGYLTACPTNVGTGIRVSVMLHLPGLVITRQIEKVFKSLQKINLAVRGLYGEGSQAMGDFYQISNQITLGLTEEELITKVADIVPVLIEYERQARDLDGPNNQFRRNDAFALQCADGREPRPHRRFTHSHDQQALHSHATGASAKNHGYGARFQRPQHRAGDLSAAASECRRRQRADA